jgi:hypothetical protein
MAPQEMTIDVALTQVAGCNRWTNHKLGIVIRKRPIAQEVTSSVVALFLYLSRDVPLRR